MRSFVQSLLTLVAASATGVLLSACPGATGNGSAAGSTGAASSAGVSSGGTSGGGTTGQRTTGAASTGGTTTGSGTSGGHGTTGGATGATGTTGTTGHATTGGTTGGTTGHATTGGAGDGGVDGGPGDAGQIDAGQTDAGSDAGAGDAGQPDAGPADGGACIPMRTYQFCALPSDCDCNLRCVTDPFLGSACELPCATSTDCSDPATTCLNGSCSINECGASGSGVIAVDGGFADGGTNGIYDGLCNAAATNDGTCLPTSDSTGNPLGLCIQGGVLDAGAPCSLSALREISMLCRGGLLCISSDGGNLGACREICNPAATPDGCLAGTACEGISFDRNAPAFWGGCFPTEDGGCLSSPANALNSCGAASGCACGSRCVADPALVDAGWSDPLANGSFCELPCTATADCADPTTACKNAGSCSANVCQPPTASGVLQDFGGRCDASDAGDGVCIADGTLGLGLCWQTGTADGGCEQSATRAQPDLLCAQGSFCFIDVNDAGSCLPLCDPGNNNVCASSAQSCNPATDLGGSFDLGYCQ
ncbi:MAG: hypothetical protein ACYCWW_04105 [Deltaproteobacteria bacterium]